MLHGRKKKNDLKWDDLVVFGQILKQKMKNQEIF